MLMSNVPISKMISSIIYQELLKKSEKEKLEKKENKLTNLMVILLV